jgi:hypothetical protein
VDVVIYLARHHTRPEDFMLSLHAQCPEYVPAVLAALAAGPNYRAGETALPMESTASTPSTPSTRSRPKRADNILPFDPKADLFPHLAPAAKAVA